MKTNPNDPIHPSGFIDDRMPPITKREYFAGQIMAGFVSNPTPCLPPTIGQCAEFIGCDANEFKQQSPGSGLRVAAKLSVVAADALIAALNAQEPSAPVQDPAAESRRAAILALAEKQWKSIGEQEVSFDPDAKVSEGESNGAFVAAWAWVDFSGTEFDKEKGEG